MRVGGSGTHLRSHPDRLHDLLGCGAVTFGSTGMGANAVRALRNVRDSDRDQLLRFHRQRPVCENALAEGPEGIGRPGGQSAAFLGEVEGRARVHLVGFRHGLLPSGSSRHRGV